MKSEFQGKIPRPVLPAKRARRPSCAGPRRVNAAGTRCRSRVPCQDSNSSGVVKMRRRATHGRRSLLYEDRFGKIHFAGRWLASVVRKNRRVGYNGEADCLNRVV